MPALASTNPDCIAHVARYPVAAYAVALMSLQAQLQAGATSNKPMQILQYGPDSPVDSSKCTAVAFIPASEGSAFAAAHWSGTVIINIKVHTVLSTLHVSVTKRHVNQVIT